MSRFPLPRLALLSPLPITAVSAEDSEHAAVLSLMDRAFAAVASGDPDDMRAIQLAEGTSLSFRPHPNGHPGELELRVSTNEALLADDSDNSHRYEERWTGEPSVRVRGPIATVWGEYEFRIDGAFSHCGVDAVDLVKLDDGWKIANWMWTVERENCPTAPQGAP